MDFFSECVMTSLVIELFKKRKQLTFYTNSFNCPNLIIKTLSRNTLLALISIQTFFFFSLTSLYSVNTQ